MAVETFRIVSPALVLFLEDGRHVSQMIPRGATVSFDKAALSGNNLIEVLWDEKVVMMFTQDLRSRGEKLESDQRRQPRLD
jgi:hypothetical protein